MACQNIGRNKWRITVRSKKYDKYFHGTRQEALKREAEVRGRKSSYTRLTLGEYLTEKWLPRLTLDKDTIAEYATAINNLSEELAAKPLSDISTFDIDEALLAQPEGSRRHKCRKVLSVSLNAAVSKRLIEYNPVSFTTVKDGKGKTIEYEAYTKEELEQLFGIFRGHVAEPVVLIMASTGLRKEEALGLDWEDVDLETGTVNVNKAWARAGKQPEEKKTKTGKSKREVYLTGYALARLNEIDGTGALWPGKKYPHIRPDAALRTYKRQLEKSSLRYVPIGMLRHAYATVSLANGGDLALISLDLGHSRISTTADRYLKPMEKQRREAAEAFGAIINEDNVSHTFHTHMGKKWVKQEKSTDLNKEAS